MGYFEAAAGVVRRLGVRSAQSIQLYGDALSLAEQTMLRLVRSRMEALAPPPALQQAAGSGAANGVAGDPVELMSSLLSRSVEQDTASGRQAYYAGLLEQLVPDEARIVAALASSPPRSSVPTLPRSFSVTCWIPAT